MKMTFNRNNWTGEMVTITINQTKRTFKHYDSLVTLKPKSKTESHESFEVIVEGYQFPVAIVQRYLDIDTNWECFDPDNSPFHGGLSRQASNMYQAVSSYLSNVM